MTGRELIPEAIARTARKPWTCVECGRRITTGTPHVEYVGEAHAYESGTRYCLPCADKVWRREHP